MSEEKINTTENLLMAIRSGRLQNFSPILPYMFELRGEPFSLKDHIMWEPLFSTEIPKKRTVKSSRQVGKSESSAIQLLTYTQVLKYVNLLYIAPRYEQTRVFSVDKVAQYIRHSPVFAGRDPDLPMNITHRVAKDGNNMYFAYAMADADRIRSKTAGGVFLDEAQDIDPIITPVISETMAASKDLGFIQNTGTPKTFDNMLELEWGRSSQAEWCIPCHSCKKLNVPGLNFDLLEMIKPQGLSCARCGKLLDTRSGWWEHRYPARRSIHDGYHLPQIVFPIHCEHQPNEDKSKPGRKWQDLLMAMEEWPTGKFYNEKLGESFDNADELISKKALVENSTLKHKNDLTSGVNAARNRKVYTFVSMGVDWGGGGESGLSRTAIAILGWKANAQPDILYMERIVNPLPIDVEVNYLRKLAQQFNVDIVADDFCGAGASKEIILLQSGFPQSKLMPIAYVPTQSKKMMVFVPSDETTATPHIKVPKAKSLAIMAALMNKGYYKFPVFESWDAKSYPEQFLALVQEKRDRTVGAASYIITHKANRADDLAHAVNYATLSYWHISNNVPDLTKMFPSEE